MDTHIPKTHFARILVINSDEFLEWFLISVDSEKRMDWFQAFLSVDRDELDKICRTVLWWLFNSLLETVLTSKKDGLMEVLFRRYLLSEDF